MSYCKAYFIKDLYQEEKGRDLDIFKSFSPHFQTNLTDTTFLVAGIHILGWIYD